MSHQSFPNSMQAVHLLSGKRFRHQEKLGGDRQSCLSVNCTLHFAQLSHVS